MGEQKTDAERCEELFQACAPFVQAEYEAEDRLKAAQKAAKGARKAAAAVRAAWVENILKHDHRALCLGRATTPAAGQDGGSNE